MSCSLRQAGRGALDGRQAGTTVEAMLDPTYALILASLALALLTVMLIPAPSRPPDAEPGIQLALLSAGCLTVIVMGAFALTDHHQESAICGAIAWLLVMPCVWLSRAPRPDGEWDEDEDDGGGGSPSPQWPSDPPAPDDRLPGLLMAPPRAPRPAIASAPVPVMATAASPPVPVVATAVKVQRMLAAREAARVRAANEVQRLLAATAALPPAQAAAAGAADPPPFSEPGPMPVHAGRPRLHSAPRARAEHGSIVHVAAAPTHGRTPRRRATSRRRSASGASRPTLRD
jgi:hypothetical protein